MYIRKKLRNGSNFNYKQTFVGHRPILIASLRSLLLSMLKSVISFFYLSFNLLTRRKRKNWKTDDHKMRVIPISMGYILYQAVDVYPKPEINKEENKAMETKWIESHGGKGCFNYYYYYYFFWMIFINFSHLLNCSF